MSRVRDRRRAAAERREASKAQTLATLRHSLAVQVRGGVDCCDEHRLQRAGLHRRVHGNFGDFQYLTASLTAAVVDKQQRDAAREAAADVSRWYDAIGSGRVLLASATPHDSRILYGFGTPTSPHPRIIRSPRP